MTKWKKTLSWALILLLLTGAVAFAAGRAEAGSAEQEAEQEGSSGPPIPDNLPVNAAAFADAEWLEYEELDTLLDIDWLYAAIQPGEADDEGFLVDLSNITTTLEGEEIDPANIYGLITTAPYPFMAHESDFAYKRFRADEDYEEGEGLIQLNYLWGSEHGTEKIVWKEDPTQEWPWPASGTIIARFELWLAEEGDDEYLGTYDLPMAFDFDGETFNIVPWISSGPLQNLVDSRHPGEVTIDFETTHEVAAYLNLSDGRSFRSPAGRKHSIKIDGLNPGAEYSYSITIGDLTSRTFAIKAAPRTSQDSFKFAYSGDSRTGYVFNEKYMGVNPRPLEQVAAGAFYKGADFMLFGGDLFDGEGTSYKDYIQQAWAWKQITMGFWANRPIYPVMGNHELLAYEWESLDDPDDNDPITIDKWPYDTASAEAAWAEAFNLPMDGPEPSDPRRPSYKENVYTFQYGSSRFIVFNNEGYWKNYNEEPIGSLGQQVGGLPDAYILDDQIEWIRQQTEAADQDPTVKYIFYCAHGPFFPNAGHGEDAMWWSGNNNVRGYQYTNGEMQPFPKGMIEVRNEVAEIMHSSRKAAAFLGSDEHGYSRILISDEVPVGKMSDDLNGDGIIDYPESVNNPKVPDYEERTGSEPATPLETLQYPLWHVLDGGAGAPYYGEEPIPWADHYKRMSPSERDKGYYFSAQENYCIFDVQPDRVSLTVYDLYGGVIDHVDDLTASKK
jgi:hypothetical protein